MKFRIYSDLHLDFYPNYQDDIVAKMCDIQASNPVDAVILAGDVCNGDNIGYLETLIKQLEYDYIFYVPGNHEHYKLKYNNLVLELERLVDKYHNLVFLNKGSYFINNILIKGGTGWFPDEPCNVLFEDMLNDFKYIPDFKDWVYLENDICNYLFNRSVLKEYKSLIITHHLPSRLCVNPKYKNSQINRFYVNPFVDVDNKVADYVVFGHTHLPYNAEHPNGTKLIANPLGYPYETRDYNWDCQIEL